jgi:hypothetical protein
MMNSKTTAESRGGDRKYKRHAEGERDRRSVLPFFAGYLPRAVLGGC